MDRIRNELLAQAEHINEVASRCDHNNVETAKSIDTLKKALTDTLFASVLANAAIVIAMEKRGLLSRDDVIRELDGLVASLFPPDSNHRAAAYSEILMQTLRRERDGTLGDRWFEA